MFYEERKQKMKETAMEDVRKRQEELKKEEEEKNKTKIVGPIFLPEPMHSLGSIIS